MRIEPKTASQADRESRKAPRQWVAPSVRRIDLMSAQTTSGGTNATDAAST